MRVANDDIASDMVNEVRAMAMHALRTGITVPAWVLESVARADILKAPQGRAAMEGATTDLNRAHGELARLVNPFTPDLIVMLELEADVSKFTRALGRVSIERIFMGVAVASVAAFVLISLSPYIKDPKYSDFFTSSGFPLLLNEFFFISAASIGASFANLFQIDRELTTGKFVPKNQSTYWVQFILGIVAGLLLSTILNIQTIAPTNSEAAGRMQFKAATLALMGGFSSSIVQRIVQRMVEALESILSGSSEHEILARDQANKQRLEETLAKNRMRTTLLLVDMQRRLAGGESPQAVQALIEQASRAIMANDPLSGPEPPSAAPRLRAAPEAEKEVDAPPPSDTAQQG
jgi:hypothetical protein